MWRVFFHIRTCRAQPIGVEGRILVRIFWIKWFQVLTWRGNCLRKGLRVLWMGAESTKMRNLWRKGSTWRAGIGEISVTWRNSSSARLIISWVLGRAGWSPTEKAWQILPSDRRTEDPAPSASAKARGRKRAVKDWIWKKCSKSRRSPSMHLRLEMEAWKRRALTWRNFRNC